MSTQPAQQLTGMFDFHRSIVAQQLEFTRDAMAAQQTMFEAATDSVDLWRSMSQQQTAMVRSVAHQALESLPEQVEGRAELEGMVDETLDQFESASESGFEATESAFDETSEAFQQFTEAYLEAMESGVDAYLDATERVEEATESVAEEIDIE